MKLEFKRTRNIYDFGPIIHPLIEEFGLPFAETLFIWCKVTPEFLDPDDCTLWEVWLVKYRNRPVGICGLYSLTESRDEVWLGWLGILPELRKKGIGKHIMKHLVDRAKKHKANCVMAYVSKEGKPLSFYKREGFKITGRVKDYLKLNKHVSMDDFEDKNDYIIKKEL